MILKAKERGGGAQLARYLLSMRDNDHVELHEVRGFVGDDLLSAFREVDAIAKGTRCENYLFSASLNPPGGKRSRSKISRMLPMRSSASSALKASPAPSFS